MLGSHVLLTLVGPNETGLSACLAELWTEIKVFEATFSRFQPDSELTLVNQRAGMRTEVSAEFIALAMVAKKWSEQTNGLYNPFVLPALQQAGYQGSWPEVANVTQATNYADRTVSNARDLQIGDDWIELPPNTALDFGGIGKGYLADQLAEQLPPDITGYWFSLGGDIICGGFDVDHQPWRIGIQNVDSSDALCFVTNTSGQPLAVATSGTTKRRGPNWHHIIDPRTALPAKTDILTATVTSNSATEADVYAKCLVILGSHAAQSFAQENGINTFALQYTDQSGNIQTYKTGEVNT